jgi:hypothetical protein
VCWLLHFLVSDAVTQASLLTVKVTGNRPLTCLLSDRPRTTNYLLQIERHVYPAVRNSYYHKILFLVGMLWTEEEVSMFRIRENGG